MKLHMILLRKGTFAPVATLLKGQRGQCPRHASILRRIVHIILYQWFFNLFSTTPSLSNYPLFQVFIPINNP